MVTIIATISRIARAVIGKGWCSMGIHKHDNWTYRGSDSKASHSGKPPAFRMVSARPCPGRN